MLTRVFCSRLHHVQLRRQFRAHAGLQRSRHPRIRHIVGFRKCHHGCRAVYSLLPLNDHPRSERRSEGISPLMHSESFPYFRPLWTTLGLRSSLLMRRWSRLSHTPTVTTLPQSHPSVLACCGVGRYCFFHAAGPRGSWYFSLPPSFFRKIMFPTAGPVRSTNKRYKLISMISYL